MDCPLKWDACWIPFFRRRLLADLREELLQAAPGAGQEIGALLEQLRNELSGAKIRGNDLSVTPAGA